MAARRLLPRVALGERLVLGRGGTGLVVVLQLARVCGRAEDLSGGGVVGGVGRVEVPHGVSRLGGRSVLEGLVPHDLTHLLAVG